MVSNNVHETAISSPEAKWEIFDRHTKQNASVLAEINKFLGDGKQITAEAFKVWMTEGKLPDGITEDMIAQPPKFIEARAMVQWNVCANKTEIMGYPLLKRQSTAQPPSIEKGEVVAIGTTTVLMDGQINSIISDVGINPLAAAHELGKKKPGDNQPKETDTPSTRPDPAPQGDTPSGASNFTNTGSWSGNAINTWVDQASSVTQNVGWVASGDTPIGDVENFFRAAR